MPSKNVSTGNSLMVQWLAVGALTAKGPGSISSQGAKILCMTWPKNKLKKMCLTNHAF